MKGRLISENKWFSIRLVELKRKKTRSYMFIIPKGLGLSHCAICGKKRKLVSHHLIPKRCKCVNRLHNLMIRSCKTCEKKNHPEYNNMWKDLQEKSRLQDRLQRQKQQIDSLLRKIEKYGLPSRRCP